MDPHVIYLSERGAGWDQGSEWVAGREGYSSEVLASWQRRRTGRSPVTAPRGLGAALRRARPDCVVSWEYGPATWRALAWCRPRRVPVLAFSELTPWSDDELSPGRRRVHRLLAPRMAGFIAASSQGRERLVRLGVPGERVEVALQSAVLEPLLAAAPVSEPRAAGGAPVRVLSVGRLVPDKNLARLVEAFAAAGFERSEAELVLAGTGPFENDLRSLAEDLGVPVRLTGPLAPSELPRLYADADVLALVSTYEPFGVTLREGRRPGCRCWRASAPARWATSRCGARTRWWSTHRAATRSRPHYAASSASRTCASASPRAAVP